MTGHKQNALNVCRSIYRMNAPYAIGYLYIPTRDGREVLEGMYCNRRTEIDPKRWSFFYRFEDKTFYNLDNERSYNTLMNKLQRKEINNVHQSQS
jgi:hypothetical protein